MTPRSAPGLVAGVLLLGAGAVSGASALPDAPAALEAIGLGLAGAAVIALADAQVRRPWRARRAARSEALAQHQADLDAVVLANVELRHVAEAGEAARRIARIATDLLAAQGAVVWLQGPGRLLCAGGHGVTPPPTRDVDRGSTVDRVLQSGSIADGVDEIVLPLTGSGGVFGAVTVSRPTRALESFVSSVLQVFGAQAGYTLERLRAVDGLIDARYVDPVTGVGNRLAATASLATLHPGDAVLLLSVDELLTIRAVEGDARADLTLGQLGLHLRTALRAGDLVARFGDDVFFVLLRDLSASTEAVVSRLLDSWQATGVAGHLRAGAALHFGDTSPLDTLDRASDALDATRAERDVTIDLASQRASRGSA
ncbi:MAG TPA: diguanylate cyclase [Acidimicrobiales bacterium]|nr:diguanylate cyclase [Acidimicrobiales bacterium]